MPTIVPRPQASLPTEDSFRQPRKSVSVSTGITLKDLAAQAATSASTNKPLINPPNDNKEVSAPTGAPKEESVSLSPQLTALARKEQRFRQQEQAFQTKQKEMQATEAKYAQYALLEKALASKDYSALEALGVNYEDYAAYAVNKLNGADPTAQAVESLKSEVESLKEQQKANVDKQYEATLAQYRDSIKTLVSKDPEYSTVKELKQEETVLEHIVQTFEQDGVALSVEQASKEVEDFLVEEALQMAKLSKIQSKLTPAAPEKKLPPPKSGLRTLTNNMAAPASSLTTKAGQSQHLSMKERIAQAVQKAQR